MNNLELYCAWGIIDIYAICSALLLTAFIFSKERLLTASAWLLTTAFIVQTGIFYYRWEKTGFFPANGPYENGITSSWFAVLLTLYLFYRKPGFRGVALVTIPGTLLALGYGIMVSPLDAPHSAALKSSWLVIHVIFAHLAFGAYLVSSGFGVLYLVKEHKQRRGIMTAFYERLPSLPAIDETMFRFVVYGFIADAVMIAAGSIWAKDLWGSYWAWDPVEVWSLVSWLIYGLTIHLRVTLGWRGRRLAWILIFAILSVVIAFWGVDFFVRSTQHVFGVRP